MHLDLLLLYCCIGKFTGNHQYVWRPPPITGNHQYDWRLPPNPFGNPFLYMDHHVSNPVSDASQRITTVSSAFGQSHY